MPDGPTDPDGAHESLCRRCGVCCHQKVRFGDVVVITDVPCAFLDPDGNRCTVYPVRYAKQPLCSSAAVSAETGTLPADCPYVGGKSDYAAPLLLRDHPEYENAVNALFPERTRGGPTRSLVRMGRHRGRRTR